MIHGSAWEKVLRAPRNRLSSHVPFVNKLTNLRTDLEVVNPERGM